MIITTYWLYLCLHCFELHKRLLLLRQKWEDTLSNTLSILSPMSKSAMRFKFSGSI